MVHVQVDSPASWSVSDDILNVLFQWDQLVLLGHHCSAFGNTVHKSLSGKVDVLIRNFWWKYKYN